MKTNRIYQKILSLILWKTKISIRNKKFIIVSLVLVLLLLSLGMTQRTLGGFLRSSILTESANAGEFNVTVTAPKEFWLEQGVSVFEYHFLSATDIQALVFHVTNNGVSDILCTPYINSDITYRIYVEKEICTEFIVAATETVEFALLLAPVGLDIIIEEAELFIDIQQLERG